MYIQCSLYLFVSAVIYIFCHRGARRMMLRPTVEKLVGENNHAIKRGTSRGAQVL
ncbi:hypothetical protein PILCRDRAFT_136387 [Piloderma croceum F 1598]|uniref:Uncharacterized protein n=1 Tax=Piloderma croceum (strain F 1598) TaxID=765440 RepID=A0A0C3G624_PILCF|nr:hypothetical protein PILCRDRAFT_136387 [Piloderma croceum F 1598]